MTNTQKIVLFSNTSYKIIASNFNAGWQVKVVSKEKSSYVPLLLTTRDIYRVREMLSDICLENEPYHHIYNVVAGALSIAAKTPLSERNVP